jgi:CHAT domain-containing protein
MGRNETVAPGADFVREGGRLAAAATRGAAGFLSYLITQDTLLIWVGGEAPALAMVRIPVGRDSLARLVERVRTALAPVEDLDRCDRVGGEGDYTAPLQALSDVLLPAAARRRLPSGGELLVVPQGVLQLVPFAALPVAAGPPLGQRYALRYAPSLAALERAGQRPSIPRAQKWEKAVVVGNPDMPLVSCGTTQTKLPQLDEAGAFSRGLARRIGASYLDSAAATEAAVQAALPAAPLVHMATHGYAYQTDARARQSWIALAPGGKDDGFLTVGEILDRSVLQAELVVLAACATGLGDSKEAEGTVGLQRALLAKGARSVLVSLWTVDESATVRLLDVFYREWLARGRSSPSKAEALRLAQEAVRTDPAHPEWRHPAYWAGFQLVGAP